MLFAGLKRIAAALSPFVDEAELQQTVWYIEARFDGGKEQSGSGVMIRLRDKRSGMAKLFLLTCQHVVRDESTNGYAQDIRCWRHGDGYNQQSYWKATRSDVVSANAGQDNDFPGRIIGGQDWVLLRVEKKGEDSDRLPHAPGFATISPLRRRYRLLGFPGGNETMERSVVKASISLNFRLAPIDQSTGTVPLAGEPTKPGYSGGPYLTGVGRVVAIHRSIRA